MIEKPTYTIKPRAEDFY